MVVLQSVPLLPAWCPIRKPKLPTASSNQRPFPKFDVLESIAIGHLLPSNFLTHIDNATLDTVPRDWSIWTLVSSNLHPLPTTPSTFTSDPSFNSPSTLPTWSFSVTPDVSSKLYCNIILEVKSEMFVADASVSSKIVFVLTPVNASKFDVAEALFWQPVVAVSL